MHVASTPSRGPNATDPHRTIVVGYDGSTEAKGALAAAAERAGKGGTVVAVFAAEPATNWLDTSHYARAVEMRREREIAVGSRRLGWLRGALGSVSGRVLRIADRPVVVVPRGAADTDSAPASDRSGPPLFSPISTHGFRF